MEGPGWNALPTIQQPRACGDGTGDAGITGAPATCLEPIAQAQHHAVLDLPVAALAHVVGHDRQAFAGAAGHAQVPGQHLLAHGLAAGADHQVRGGGEAGAVAGLRIAQS
ncbi:hypothetical protein G6F58_013231 [Rhizopus delemar]|nr:hypothetical protein G6F58_013231 [Rhizopus delemar]